MAVEDDSATRSVRSRSLTIAEQERVKAMQRLANAPDRATYLALQQVIAQELNMTVRNVRHLIRAWQSETDLVAESSSTAMRNLI